VRTLLDIYERVIQANPGLPPGTLVIEHAFLADAAQRARIIWPGVWVTVQHPLLYALGGSLVRLWGPERTRQIMLVEAWLDEGGQLSAGTDYPVSSFDPLQAIWGFVTRGTKEVGVQGPEYAIDQYTTVWLYTAGGALLDGESHRRGILEPRRLADLVAFNTDPITCPVDALLTHRPVFTLVGGQCTIRNTDWSGRTEPDGRHRQMARGNALPGPHHEPPTTPVRLPCGGDARRHSPTPALLPYLQGRRMRERSAAEGSTPPLGRVRRHRT
jgi:predicted amidohydrolase YtcJ